MDIYTCICILLYFYMLVQEPLKKEHRTSNVQRPTSNNDVASLRKLFFFFYYFCFFSAILMLLTKILINSSISSYVIRTAYFSSLSFDSHVCFLCFPFQHSMLEVRCSMFIFLVPPTQIQLRAIMGYSRPQYARL